MQRAFTSILFSALPLATLGCLIPLTAKAQVTPDGTTSTTVNQDGNNFTIEQGDRVGDNLFHSFNQFSVPTLGSAAFNNAGDIANIFSRVTGSSISSIDGLISANGAANLFLINPNGILFGENASLNLGGSFFASTADSLLFEGNRSFSASNPQAPPLLEVSIPIGLNFRDNPEDIVNSSIVNGFGLLVNRENIALIGGDVSFNNGNITAPGGKVELGGLNASGTIGINADGSLSFPENVERGNVFLRNGSKVNLLSGGGGSIAINSKNLEITEGSLFIAGIGAGLGSKNAQVGDIVINATDKIVFDGAGANGLSSGIYNYVQGLGDTGEIQITTSDLSLTNGGKIVSLVSGNGNSGDITIEASNNIFLDGTILVNNQLFLPSSITSNVVGTGKSGDINIFTNNLSLTNNVRIGSETLNRGNAGNINLTATDSIFLDGSVIASRVVIQDAIGNGGDIGISTGNLKLSNNSNIGADNIGTGKAGNIEINATEKVIFDQSSLGSIVVQGSAGAIFVKSPQILLDNSEISTSNLGIGTAGNISIEASDIFSAGNGSLILSNVGQADGTPAEGKVGDIAIAARNVSFSSGSQLQAGFYSNSQGESGSVSIIATDFISFDGRNSLTGNNSGIFTNVEPGAVANGSDIKLEAQSISFINGAGLIASNSGTGNSGNISIKANNFSTANDISILSNIGQTDGTPAKGKVGSIAIEAKNVALTDSSQIQAGFFSNTQGESGSVSIKAIDSISFDDRSGIFTSVAPGAIADGGNIQLEANSISFTNTSGLSASNSGQGNGGNITVDADSLTLDKNSAILASNTPSQTFKTDLAGGNIDLSISDIFILRNNSQINTLANQNANGGNVTINANDGLIVAFPNQNNDITTNAVQGKGGEISIFTQTIFGLKERSSTPPNQTNDIDASSEFGLQGTFSLNTPDFDPTTGLINLPASVGDASDQISQNPCQRGIGSEFLVTGKGGLPPNVNESLNSESAQVGLIESVPSQQQTVGANGETLSLGGFPDLRKVSNPKDIRPNPSTTPEAVPAQGWVFNDRGEVTLTAYETTNTEIKRSPQTTNSSCSALSTGINSLTD